MLWCVVVGIVTYTNPVVDNELQPQVGLDFCLASWQVLAGLQSNWLIKSWNERFTLFYFTKKVTAHIYILAKHQPGWFSAIKTGFRVQQAWFNFRRSSTFYVYKRLRVWASFVPIFRGRNRTFWFWQISEIFNCKFCSCDPLHYWGMPDNKDKLEKKLIWFSMKTTKKLLNGLINFKSNTA